MFKKFKSVCGLDCASCPAYIALQTNDDKLRAKTATEWTEKYDFPFKKEMINCSGCLSTKEPHCGYCSMCPVRKCSLSKKITHCVFCKEFTECKIRQDFEKETGLNMLELK
jgi:hypothetical protein